MVLLAWASRILLRGGSWPRSTSRRTAATHTPGTGNPRSPCIVENSKSHHFEYVDDVDHVLMKSSTAYSADLATGSSSKHGKWKTECECRVKAYQVQKSKRSKCYVNEVNLKVSSNFIRPRWSGCLGPSRVRTSICKFHIFALQFLPGFEGKFAHISPLKGTRIFDRVICTMNFLHHSYVPALCMKYKGC